MESPPRARAIPSSAPGVPAAWELPGVRALLQAPRPVPELGLRWAVAVFCTFAAPPAVMVAGLLHRGAWPVGFWLAACAFLFTGLGLSLRLDPLPPRRVLETPRPGARRRSASEFARRARVADAERCGPWVLDLPGIHAGMSRSEMLEQLAKLREQGDLSGREYLRARRELRAG